MNLLEVIFSLHGLKSGDRRRRLVEWGIDVALWEHIQALFAQDGEFVFERDKLGVLVNMMLLIEGKEADGVAHREARSIHHEGP
jgi:hypothetical protein